MDEFGPGLMTQLDVGADETIAMDLRYEPDPNVLIKECD